MGAMTKGVRLGALLGVCACGGAEVVEPAAPEPQPTSNTTRYSDDGLFSARWVDGLGELRVTRSAAPELGCRSASYQVEALGAVAGGTLELRYDRRNLEPRLLLGWARVDGATTKRLGESTLAGPGVIQVAPTPTSRYCAIGPEPIQPMPDPESARAPIGSGQVYALSAWRFAGAGEGLEEGSSCAAEPWCSENSLAYLGPRLNDSLRQQLLGGGLLQLVELVGLDGAAGRDPQWVLKSYLALDADDPIYPANNFRPAYDTGRCCEFLAAESSLDSGQARAIAGAVFDEGVARTTEDSSYELVLEIEDSLPETVVTVSQVRWRFSVQSEPLAIEGRLTGVLRISELAAKPDLGCRRWPYYCSGEAPLTWLDGVSTRVKPDRDLDGDGLESVFDADGDGHIDRCCDGPLAQDRGCRPGEEVPALWFEDPGSCALQPEMADGYSLTMAFEGVPAHLIGVGAAR